MQETIDIPSLFDQVTTKVNTYFSTRKTDPFNVYFAYGHYDAVNKKLVQKSESTTMKDTKYPLIWMVTPFSQVPTPKSDSLCELSGLDFLFLMGTNENDSIEQRVEKYFKPRLWPIVDRFKYQIEMSGFFQVLSADAIPMDYQKDWFYQSGLSGKNNLFSDTIDAVQMKGVRLRVNELTDNLALR